VVEVDYGPKGKPPLKKSLTLKEGSTVVDATRATVDLKQGFVCCDPKDVETIGGVKCDPENEGWWLYDINGEKGQVSACRYLLADGDRIRWFYRVSGSLHKVKVPGYRVTQAGTGVVEGRVEVEGKVPFLPDYRIHKNVAYCGRSISKPNPCRRSQDAGRLAMAVVWLSGVKEGKDWAPAPPPRLDQKNCEFIPHIVVAPLGSILTLTSQDSVLHTLHALDADHRTLFNLAMPDAGSKHDVTLSEKGVWDIQCDAGHRWMKAHLVVMENPYWTLSAKDGSYRLEGVPPGTYTLNVWHDLYGLQTKEITVSAGSQDLSTIFKAEDFRMDLRYVEAKE
jgi:plastocyanin